MTADEKWIHYSNLKSRKSWGLPSHASTSSVRTNIHAAKVMLCIWWDQVGVIYCQQFRLYEDIEKWLGSWIASKYEHFYRNDIRALPEIRAKVAANDGQYFE